MSPQLRAPAGKVRTVSGWRDLKVGPPDEDVDFPTLESTGPRSGDLEPHSGTITTSSNGQVIEGLEIAGRIRIQHDDVIVRDCIVRATSTYMIHVMTHATAGRDPGGILIEYTSVDGINSADNCLAMYGQVGGWTLDHCNMYDINRAIMVRRNCRIQHCYVDNNRTFTDAHREAIQFHGGGPGGIEIVHNTLYCRESGTSASVALYGDQGVVDGVLVENNLLAARAHHILYGGSVSGKPYPDGNNVRVINNHFSDVILSPSGVTPNAINGLDAGERGNVSEGNIWHETGDPI